MGTIKIFSPDFPQNGARFIQVDECTVQNMKLDYDSRPYMTFSHPEYPLGSLVAYYVNNQWECELD